jgi:hypothetical protein
MKNPIATLTAFVMLSTTMTGCPLPANAPVAPFDATGTYVGTWSGSTTTDATAKQDVQECPLEFTLTQDVDAAWPQRFAVSGSAYIDYSCLELPEWAETPPPSVIQVAGVMDEQGKVGLVSGACGTGMCVALGLDGPGVDADGDGLMDSISGEWQYSLLLAGFTPFIIRGSFEAAAEMYE